MKLAKILISLLFIITILAACGTSPNNETEPQESNTEVVQASPISEETAVVVEDTAITRGAALFVETRGGFACATCHYTTENRLLGPGLANTAERVATYTSEASLDAYLHMSIVNPLAFIAPAEPPYPANIMPSNYAEIFTEAEISDLIAYILSL